MQRGQRGGSSSGGGASRISISIEQERSTCVALARVLGVLLQKFVHPVMHRLVVVNGG
jgi:hypothetical protein